MKVAISKGIGGFYLSQKALQWLIDNKGWTTHAYTDGVGVNAYPVTSIHDYHLETGEYTKYAKYNKRYAADHDSYTDKTSEFRSHPDVIEVIETLGDEVNEDTEYLNIVIIEVPDDVKWYIDEGDSGSEWVAECHRTWS